MFQYVSHSDIYVYIGVAQEQRYSQDSIYPRNKGLLNVY